MAPAVGVARPPSIAPPRRAAIGVVLLLAKQGIRDARIRTVVFVYLFAIDAYVQPVGYRHTYPSLGDRQAFADSLGGNLGLRLLYGRPHAIQTTDGYTAWRTGGVLAIAAVAFGVLAAVRALRGEEEPGRSEFLLAGPTSRASVAAAAGLTILTGVGVLWVAEWGGLLAAGIPVGGAAFLSLATVSVALVGAGVGAMASQLAATSRAAFGLGGAAVAVLFVLRVLADTVRGVGWLSWLTPLGWAERLLPLTNPQPLVLLLPAASAFVLLTFAARLARRRDVGTGLLPRRDRAPARLGLLHSPTQQALRSQVGPLAGWLGGVAVLLFILGVVSHSLSDADVPQNVQDQLAKLGAGSITTPVGYLALLFLFVTVALCVFACAQISALRQEEIHHLETLLAQPVSRRRWLGGRLLLTVVSAAGIGLTAGLAAWTGARVTGVPIALPRLLEAGANALPVTTLFLGFGALAYALIPEAATALTYGLLAASFLWQLVGALLGPPQWVLDLSPFAHTALVPTQSFQPAPAAVMVGLGLLTSLGALITFARRDLITD